MKARHWLAGLAILVAVVWAIALSVHHKPKPAPAPPAPKHAQVACTPKVDRDNDCAREPDSD